MRPSPSVITAVLAAVAVLTTMAAGDASADELTARSAVERADVFVGEPFVFQIQVDGSDAPEKLDVSHISDFAVESLGGQQNSSSSVTIINGRMTQDVRHGYIFSYRLTPKRAGQLTIPAVTVKAGGQTAATMPLSINASTPTETDDFKLRLALSSDRCYVGQPVTLTVTWYIGKDVEGFQFAAPFLSDERFGVADAPLDIDPNQQDRYLRIPVGGGEVVGEKGREKLEDKEYLIVRFRKILIPKAAGTIAIPQATVTCNALVSGQGGRSRGPFDDFFGGMNRGAYKKFVTPSNEPTLIVQELPSQGRPANFTGLVGKYDISASAAPVEVKVGDPITLTVRVSGPDYLENVSLPALDTQPNLARDFKIPSDMAAAKIEGKAKVFTQTVRAKSADVKAIPPIELPYFDAGNGAYLVARTQAIPLAVSPTREVTAHDAEGRAVEASATELETWTSGIAHNYEGPSVLASQTAAGDGWDHSPIVWAILGLPPLAYLALLGAVAVARHRQADPGSRIARQAHGAFVRTLRELQSAGDPCEASAFALEALRQYLGAKLRLPPGALTYGDIREPLRTSGVSEEELDALRSVFERCEASAYAGAAMKSDVAPLVGEALETVARLEKKLR
jgi:hypothetical protein